MSLRTSTTDRLSLGILLSVGPESPSTCNALQMIERSLESRIKVSVYLSDEAVLGLQSEVWRNYLQKGLRVFVCALSARNRAVEMDPAFVFCGLAQLNEIMVHSDRFIGFN